MMIYITLLSFNWTSSMTSINNWSHYSIFSVDFLSDLLQKVKYSRFWKRCTVREEKDRPNNTCTLWNISFQRVMQNWFYLHFRRFNFSQIPILLNWKTTPHSQCCCQTYGTMIQTKNQNWQEHLLDSRKTFDATDHEISDWMTGTWGAPQTST